MSNTVNEQSNISSKIRMLVSEFTGIDVEKIHDDDRLVDDLEIVGDDAYEFLEKYKNAFSIDFAGFDFTRYFPTEGQVSSVRYLFDKHKNQSSRESITINDLILIALKKKWG